MKHLLLVLSIFLFSCNSKIVTKEIIVHDTVKTEIIDTVAIHDLTLQYDLLNQRNIRQKAIIDSLRTNLFQANFKVNQCKFYVKLMKTNKKKYSEFFFGWIRVVVE